MLSVFVPVFITYSALLNLFHWVHGLAFVLLPSQDLTIALLMLAIADRWGGRRLKGAAFFTIWLVCGISALYSQINAAYSLFGHRPLDIGRDVYMISSGIEYLMMVQWGWGHQLLFYAACLILPFISFVGSYFALIRLRQFRAHRLYLTLLLPAAILPNYRLYDASLAGLFPVRTGIQDVTRLGQIAFNFQESYDREQAVFFRELWRLKTVRKDWPSPELKKRIPGNLYIFIVESYGLALLQQSPGRLTTGYQALKQLAQQNDLEVFSSLSESSTFGGGSWMSDLSLECGVRIDRQPWFDGFFVKPLPCLSNYLSRSGYHTVDVRPSTTEPFVQAQTILEYRQHMYFDDLSYQGPEFRFSRMPDQYAIVKAMSEIKERTSTTPRYVNFQLSSSHHDYRLIPKFLASMDHSLKTNGKNYEDAQVSQPYLFSGSQEQKIAYANAIAYVFAAIEWFVENYVEPGDTILILGDHQPQPDVVGGFTPLHVPIHFLSASRQLNRRLEHYGFTPGFTMSLEDRKPLRHQDILGLLVSDEPPIY